MRWHFWRGEGGKGTWSCVWEADKNRKGACQDDDQRQKMRNCPRTDLGHEPYETNPAFGVPLSRGRCRVCPVGLITERSEALLELFMLCHAAEPGWAGTSYRQICWPTAQTLFDEHYLMVQAFQIIRNEIAEIQAEQSKK